MTDLERLGTQLAALEAALEAARQEPNGAHRRHVLAAVQRATSAVRRDHEELVTAVPHLRVIDGGRWITDGKYLKGSRETISRAL